MGHQQVEKSEGELRHRLPHSSSASRFTAGRRRVLELEPVPGAAAAYATGGRKGLSASRNPGAARLLQQLK